MSHLAPQEWIAAQAPLIRFSVEQHRSRRRGIVGIHEGVPLRQRLWS
jgi:hypothetical protein